LTMERVRERESERERKREREREADVSLTGEYRLYSRKLAYVLMLIKWSDGHLSRFDRSPVAQA
jgi:hypothetical protein